MIFNGTSGAADHLRRKHKVDIDTSESIEPTAEPLRDSAARLELTTVKRANIFVKLLIRWLVYCHIALAMLENQYFRDLITYCNKSLGNLLPYGRATL